MTIILFLIDTSASMNQRTYLGARPTLLDVAKDAVEKFLKARARDMASRGDRYMLLTFEDPPANIKAGWKENHAQFMNELKHLTATGVTNLGSALKNAFDLLNLNRIQSGIDMYGLGRAPYYLEPAMIVVITDGSLLTNPNGVQPTLELPMQTQVVPGSELTREPFRWDQRLFSLVLRLTGSPPTEATYNASLNMDHSPIGAMCAVTGGRSYTITTQRSILQSIDALVSKIQSGVVIHFEKIGPEPPPLQTETTNTPAGENSIGNNGKQQQGDPNSQQQQSQPLTNNNNPTPSSNGVPPNNTVANLPQMPPPNWHSTRSLIYVRTAPSKNFPVGHWPIPEAYWPDPNLNALPPRTAHPIVKFTCTPTEPHMLDSLPFDKYELESSPLTQYILSRKQPHVAWQVYIANSGRIPGDLGVPFGYLKAATNLNCVNLFVMPYNYPVLLPLIEEMLKKPPHTGKPIREWRPAFDEYLRTMPPYYATPLKRALTRMGAPSNLVPDNLECAFFSYAIHNKLKNQKTEAKVQFDRLLQSIQQQASKSQAIDAVRVINCGNNLRSQVESTSYSNMSCTGRPTGAFYSRYQTMKNELNEFPNYVIRVRDKASSIVSNENIRTKHTFRNPFDIDRKDLIDQIHLMRVNFMQCPSRIKLRDEDQIHTLPVAQMGNYQEYLKRQPAPLREIESTPVRQHMFGNPFKIDKKGMMVDEADSLGINTDTAGSPLQKNKKLSNNQRRRGPLPRSFILINEDSWRRSPTSSPTPSNPSSPPRTSPDDTTSSSTALSPNAASSASSSPSSSNASSSLAPTLTSPSSSDISNQLAAASSILSATASSSIQSELQKLNGNSSPSPSIIDSSTGLVKDNANANNHNSYLGAGVSSTTTSSKGSNEPLRPTEQDLALRSDIFKHIRGPGINYASVLKTISKLEGDKRKFILEETIREAKRFKKVRLLHQLNLIGRQ